MRSATSRAKPISCVTHIMVMPLSAKSCITFNTSPTISGSSAEVGSSNSITRGSIASPRAIATRCCCPPESWLGNASFLCAKPTRSNSSIAFSSACSRLCFFTFIGDRMMFSNTVRCGYRLKPWNTKPTSSRTLFKSVCGSATLIPSTQISPLSMLSSWLTVRMSVDLPLPEGPQTTTTSPCFTSRLTPLMTCRSLKCLCTFLNLIMLFPDVFRRPYGRDNCSVPHISPARYVRHGLAG